MRRLLDDLRGARHIALFAALALLALAALLAMNVRGTRDTGGTALELRLQRLLSGLDGVGQVRVMITTDGEGRPEGVAVVCDGLCDMRAYLEIQSAIQALLDVDVTRIRIIGRNGFGGAAT